MYSRRYLPDIEQWLQPHPGLADQRNIPEGISDFAPLTAAGKSGAPGDSDPCTQG